MTTVAAGAEVTWENHDDIPHNIVATDRSFRSQVLDTGEKWAHQFEKKGEYGYYCSLHTKMTGRVLVI